MDIDRLAKEVPALAKRLSALEDAAGRGGSASPAGAGGVELESLKRELGDKISETYDRMRDALDAKLDEVKAGLDAAIQEKVDAALTAALNTPAPVPPEGNANGGN